MAQESRVQERALSDALKARPARPEDAAMVAAARRLAQLIDRARDTDDESAVVVKLAAEYRQTLVQLGLTPAARAAMSGKGAPADAAAPRSPLDELRKRREQRTAGT